MIIEWFHEQPEFTTAFECMSTEEMNKCLSKFYCTSQQERKTEIATKKLVCCPSEQRLSAT